jgi:lipopolysaccharide export system permease protein
MLLYRYIVKEHIFPFLASLGIIVFLFIMQQAIFMLDRIVSKNIDPMVVLEVFIIQLGWILALGIPMAILSATLMTFGRMAGDNEITAIKASGRSMAALVVPVMALAAVMTVSLFFFHDLILPEANHHAANLLGDISRKRPAAFIESGVLIKDFPNYTLYVEHVNSKTGDLKGVRIFSDDPNQDPNVTVAQTGNIRVTDDGEYIELSLFNGETHSTSRKNEKDYFIARFAKQVFYLKNIDTRLERTTEGNRGDREKTITMMMDDVREFKESSRTMALAYTDVLDSVADFIARMDTVALTGKQVSHADSAAAPKETAPDNVRPAADTGSGGYEKDSLAYAFAAWGANLKNGAGQAVSMMRSDNITVDRYIRAKQANDAEIARYMVEIHKKFAIPVACIIFVLIGAPLGIMARRGGLAVGATYSVFFFVIYWASLISGENLADRRIISPAAGMWAGNVFLAACGAALMILMMRETSISLSFFKNLFGKKSSAIVYISGTRIFRLLRFFFRLPGMLFRLPRRLLSKAGGILPSYLMGTFLGYAFGLLAALVVIFVTIDYVSNLNRFEQASYFQIGLYYYYYLPWITQTVLPIVLFLSSMFSMGRLAKTSELTAIKAAGVNVRQLTMPLLALGALISIGVFFGGEKYIPHANEQRRLIRGNFSKDARPEQPQKAVREYRRNFFYFGTPDIMYVFNEFCTEPQFFRRVSRYTFTENGIAERVDAAEAEFDGIGWGFTHGERRVFSEDGMSAAAFAALPDSVLKAEPPEMVKRLKSVEEMSYWELSGFIEAARRRGEQVQKYMAELEFKIALPVMNFVVILFGLSLSARSGRKGGAALFGLGLLLSFLYWILSRFALVFAQNGYIPTLWGAWIGNVIFFILGIALYRKAAH